MTVPVPRPSLLEALQGHAVDERDAARYEYACAVLVELVGLCAAGAARATTHAEAAEFAALQRRYLREKQQLTPTDRAEVHRILAWYEPLRRALTRVLS